MTKPKILPYKGHDSLGKYNFVMRSLAKRDLEELSYKMS